MGYYFSPYRKEYHALIQSGAVRTCPFCPSEVLTRQTVYSWDGSPVENATYRWVINYYPYCNAHTLIVPKRHVMGLEELTAEELQDYHAMVRFAVETLRRLYPDAGAEIFMQFGKGSRMSLPHLHTHVVPALPDDPFRGMEKLGQFEALEEGKEKIVLLPVDVTLAREELLQALANIIDADWLAKLSRSR